jgi:hypothetical protein
MRRLQSTAIIALLMLTYGCQNGDKRGGTDLGSGSVAEKCKDAKKGVDVPKGSFFVIVQAAADSKCPVNVSASNVSGSVQPGATFVRGGLSEAGFTASFDCGSNEELTCKYSYALKAVGRAAFELAEGKVKDKCKSASRTLDLGAGQYNLTVTPDASSDCDVEVAGYEGASGTPEKGKARTFTFQVGGIGKETAKVTLSCGTDDTKACSYSYTLSKAGK